MGLIRMIGDAIGAGAGAFNQSTQSAMWKEYFVSGDMSDGVLMCRAKKVLASGGRNNKSDNNLISSGSGIDVQDNQCMIVVENGRIVEFTNEPGRFTYDSSSQPSLFSGENKGLKALGKEIMAQWSAGGQRFSTQRVYFINMGELIRTPIKWGFGNLGFRTTRFDDNTGNILFSMNVDLKGNGVLTVQIDDPIKFYRNIGSQLAGGDNQGEIKINDEGLLDTLKPSIVGQIRKAVQNIGSKNKVSHLDLGNEDYDPIITGQINELLSNEWAGQRGFQVVSFSISELGLSDESEKRYNELEEKYNMVSNPMLANYDIQKTMAKGIENAGANGGTAGLMGVGMGMGAIGGMNLGNLQPDASYVQQQQMQQQMRMQQMQPQREEVPQTKVSKENSWTCSCGTVNTGKFCTECGEKQPVKVDTSSWTCSCGAVNTGKFCSECGNKRPEKKNIVCDKCGWRPNDMTRIPKFCPECGEPINEADFQ